MVLQTEVSACIMVILSQTPRRRCKRHRWFNKTACWRVVLTYPFLEFCPNAYGLLATKIKVALQLLACLGVHLFLALHSSNLPFSCNAFMAALRLRGLVPSVRVFNSNIIVNYRVNSIARRKFLDPVPVPVKKADLVLQSGR